MYAARSDEIVGNVFCGVDGDGEANTRCRASGRVDRGINPNYIAMRIDEWPARISAVDGRVGLNGFLNSCSLARLYRAANGADDSGGKRRLEAEWISDCQNFLPNLNR